MPTDAETRVSMPLGVVLERRKSANRWIDWSWSAVAVAPGVPAVEDWTPLREGPGWSHYHAGVLDLSLFRKETEGYKFNLTNRPPKVFVVLRQDEDGEHPHEVYPFLITACPYEAQDYLDSGEEIVDAVLMPDLAIGFVKDFIDRHHVDEPFEKRKRRDHRREHEKFARPPDWAPGGSGRDDSR